FSIVLRDATAFRLGMSAVIAFPDSVSDSRSRARFPVRRPVCLTLLLLAEVLLLQVRFDTSALQGARTWWSTLIGHAHFLPMIAVPPRSLSRTGAVSISEPVKQRGVLGSVRGPERRDQSAWRTSGPHRPARG